MICHMPGVVRSRDKNELFRSCCSALNASGLVKDFVRCSASKSGSG